MDSSFLFSPGVPFPLYQCRSCFVQESQNTQCAKFGNRVPCPTCASRSDRFFPFRISSPPPYLPLGYFCLWVVQPLLADIYAEPTDLNRRPKSIHDVSPNVNNIRVKRQSPPSRSAVLACQTERAPSPSLRPLLPTLPRSDSSALKNSRCQTQLPR